MAVKTKISKISSRIKKIQQVIGGSKAKVSKFASDDFNVMVEKKAYELYEQRGCQHGQDWNDWFEAERIIRSQ